MLRSDVRRFVMSVSIVGAALVSTALFGVLVVAGGACMSSGVPRAKAPAPMASLGASAGSTELGWSDDACLELMGERDSWTFAGGVLSALGGGGAIGTAAPDDKWVKWGIGASSAVLGLAGGAAVLVAKSKAAAFEQYCEMKPEVRPMDAPRWDAGVDAGDAGK